MRRPPLSLMVMAVTLAACTSAPAATTGPTATRPDPALAPLLELATSGDWRSTGDDAFEVWICHVPANTTAAIYGGLPLRLPLTPGGVAAILTAHVTPYFDTLSGGRYRPVFRAGGEVTMAAADAPQACLDRAIDGAGPTTRAVLAVADAEHGADQQGGFGNGGRGCPGVPPCPVAQSRRSAYVGASDFHPDWGNAPPMDLIEHEIGHTLGWVHSGVDASGRYLSALDVMSNSAAPRDTSPDRRDGPDTLGVNRLLAGWLPPADVWTVPANGGSTRLFPSFGASGTRLAVVALGSDRFLTMEVLAAAGFDAHLPAAGVAVHRLTIVDGVLQPIEPLVGEPPFTALLQPGASFETDAWHLAIGVPDASGAWAVTVEPSG